MPAVRTIVRNAGPGREAGIRVVPRLRFDARHTFAEHPRQADRFARSDELRRDRPALRPERLWASESINFLKLLRDNWPTSSIMSE